MLLKRLKNPIRLELQEPLTIYSRVVKKDIVAPKGFITDGASVPPKLRGIFGCPLDKHLEISIIHDFLYSNLSNLNYSDIDFKTANLIFYDGLKIAGIGTIKSWIMYKAVCWFGYSHYKKD
jgi:hypothetical protein